MMMNIELFLLVEIRTLFNWGWTFCIDDEQWQFFY